MNLKLATLLVALVGLGVSIYLSVEALSPHVPLYCSTPGVINCERVTTSVYSRILGVPVALLGVAWFVVEIGLIYVKSWFAFPCWVLGMAFVGYLLFSEYVLGSICLYCTAVHITVVAIGYPVWKLSTE